MYIHSTCLYSSIKCSLASNGIKVQMLWPNVHLTPYMSPLCIGADSNSDHYLCVAKRQLKLKRVLKQPGKKGPNINELQSGFIRSTFNVNLANSFQTLQDIYTDPEDAWMNMKESYNEVAITVLGYANKPAEEWITGKTWKEIGRRKDCKKMLLGEKYQVTKQILQNKYRKIGKSVKRKTRRDKRAYIDTSAEKAEDAANRGDMRTLYDITKKLSGDFGQSREGPVKDKIGAVLTSDEEKKARWAEHFHETVNRLPPSEPFDFSIYEEMEALQIDLREITLEEVKKAIKGMKNHKAAGEDNIAAELVKATSDKNLVTWLKLYNCVWNTERIPSCEVQKEATS